MKFGQAVALTIAAVLWTVVVVGVYVALGIYFPMHFAGWYKGGGGVYWMVGFFVGAIMIAGPFVYFDFLLSKYVNDRNGRRG